MWFQIEDIMPEHPTVRRLMVWGIDLFAIVTALPLAYALRFNLTLDFLDDSPREFFTWFVILVTVRCLLFYAFRLRRMVWRYTDILELQRLVVAATTGTLLTVSIVAFITRLQGMPRSVFILEWGVYLFLTAGVRIAYRMLWEMGRKRIYGRPLQTLRPVIIIGAGRAGSMLAKELQQSPRLGERAVAFVDDDASKRNREVCNIMVFGPFESLPEIMERFETRRVYIATPSATATQMRRIVRICEEAGADFRTLPSLGDLLSGTAILHQLRPVQLEDLLGREPVSIDVAGISTWLRDKRVLVTGAAGSIGSELCRQLLRLGVRHLTLLDQSEFHLYLLQNEIRAMQTTVPHRCMIGSVTDPTFVADVLREEKPQVIFHVAAYKHVHLMEENPRAALITNVIGTATVGEAAIKAEVEHFVLVSTDKAVRPTSVMGATKRLAEELCMGFCGHGSTIFQVVRFGNVLGSSGSVVPLFERQLAAGGPLTVTHPEVTRFFMTIPEAARLILQAVVMGRQGEIFLLEMGEPVKIVDLAEQMIRLAGKEPYTDVPIQFIGLRPGEKLHEELWRSDEQFIRTAHPKILRADFSASKWQPGALLSEVQMLLQLTSGAVGPAVVALANWLSSDRKQTELDARQAPLERFVR